MRICIQREKIWETLLVTPRPAGPDPSQELSIFSQAHSFSIENYGLGRVLKVFWGDREPFLQKRFPDINALNACWYNTFQRT
jgi:hypothetical protein